MDLLKTLAPKPVDLEIVQQGETITLTIVPPSRMEWLEIEGSVTNPVVPNTRIDERGVKVPNPQDVAYQQKLMDANARRVLLLVTHALVKGGNELPGDTLAAQADALDAVVDGGVINAVYGYLRRTLSPAAEAIKDRAAGFQQVPGGGAEDV